MSRILNLILATFAIACIVLLGYFAPSIAALNAKKQYANLSQYINSFNTTVQELDLSKTYLDATSYAHFLEDKNHHLFVSENNQWVYWSSIAINPNIPQDNCDSFKSLRYSPTGFDYIVMRSQGKKKYYFIAHLKNAIDKVEDNADLLPCAPYDNWLISPIAEKKGLQIFDKENTFLFSAVLAQNSLKYLFWLDFILLVLGGIFLFFALCKKASVGFALVLSLTAALLVFRLLKGFKLGFIGMQEFKLFTASVYAHSQWLPSIGDLLINSVFFLLLSTIIANKLWPKGQQYYLIGVVFANSAVFIYLVSLFQDSQISFNFNQLSSIDFYSILGIVIVLIWFIAVHQLNRRVLLGINIKLGTLAISIASVLLVLYLIDNGLSIYKVLGILFFFCYYLLHLAEKKYGIGNHFLVGIFLFGIIFTYINQSEAIRKERDLRKIFLKNEVFDNKVYTQNQIGMVESLIADDTFLLKNENLGSLDFNNMNKRLAQLYFANINKDYEVKLYSFSAGGRNIYDPSSPINVDFLSALYDNLPFDESLNYFKEINNEVLPADYIAKYDKCIAAGEDVQGTIFLLLTHKSFAIQESYNSTLSSWLKNNGNTYNYSYAIYGEDSKIKKRKGLINYPVYLDTSLIDFKDTFVVNGEISHYFWMDSLYNQMIMVSLEVKNWDDFFTNFSFFILLCLVLIITILGSMYAAKSLIDLLGSKKAIILVKQYFDYWVPSLQISKLFLSRRIVISFTTIVLVGFLVTLLFVIRYIQQSENERYKEQHYAKVEESINKLNGKSFGDILIENNKNGLLLSLANELKIDLSLFGKNGELFATSSNKIKDGSLQAPLLPFGLLQQVKNSKTGIEMAQLLLGNKEYMAYCYAIIDDNNELSGVLFIPYFGGIHYNKGDEIIKTLVNLYAILLLFGVGLVLVVAKGITKPLNLLSERLATLKIGGVFKPIPWKGEDEISQLVKQYNQTVQQLEISTNKLAEKERQGAWKEMAQQVAHEIKNPLTPMRLNLQHLQITLRSEDSERSEKNNKIIHMLLSQIDKLTKLADDFSSFATITDTNPVVVNVAELVEEMVHLYNKQALIAIHYKITNFNALVYIDKIGLERVLNNLFKNAIQAMDEKGMITVSAKITKSYLTIAIKDNGKGIEKELYKKIFSPNFSTKSSGMGIGLAMSKRIIEHAHGQISFESAIGKGTTFFVQLPLYE